MNEIPQWPQLAKALATASVRGDLLREGRRLLQNFQHPDVKAWIGQVDIECGAPQRPVSSPLTCSCGENGGCSVCYTGPITDLGAVNGSAPHE